MTFDNDTDDFNIHSNVDWQNRRQHFVEFGIPSEIYAYYKAQAYQLRLQAFRDFAAFCIYGLRRIGVVKAAKRRRASLRSLGRQKLAVE